MKRIIFFCGIAFIIYCIGVIIVNIPQEKSTKENVSFNSSQNPSDTSKLDIKDEKIGTGSEVLDGDTITVNYVGNLTSGKQFDSSYDRKQPFTFKVGSGEVIKGWDKGVIGMKIGGKRKLTIPPELGYGDKPQGAIPANSTLVFEIELVSVLSQAEEQSPKPNL
ncbi:MAG: FKBP-type peptidyl-prolyl cis-trans isomerase [Candidatus Levybacteria bacterium]|nr:FKBP-type peptidyl-prolyl cis-trans isomerase [Candidatus Levybacteria bacterium]